MKSPMLHNRKPPTVEAYKKYAADNQKAVDLVHILSKDFQRAIHQVAEKGDQFNSRVAVRCFGAMIDAIALMMRQVACNLCELFGEPLNPLLTEKTAERSTTGAHRVVLIYRLLAEFAPSSPLAKIPEERWDGLHRAIAARNRVTHPTCEDDLGLFQEDMDLILKLGTEFAKDIPGFVYWTTHQKEELFNKFGGTRERMRPKVGRNDPCPCGSQKKFKACCGAVA